MPEPVTLIGVAGGLLAVLGTLARRYFETAKEVVDVLFGAVLLVLLLPGLAICAAIIRCSSRGPIFHKQVRAGRYGQPFVMYKLRTMYTDAEAHTGPRWAERRDPRVVPACRWMRLSHVDELPQLLNVIKGEMSLVGPRPERPEIVEKLRAEIPDFDKRLAVRPGITGLAQVRNGYDGSLEGTRRKLQADLEYIERRRWGLELRILAGTLTKLHDKGAN